MAISPSLNLLMSDSNKEELKIYEGALDVRMIFRKWLEEEIDKTMEHLLPFCRNCKRGRWA